MGTKTGGSCDGIAATGKKECPVDDGRAAGK